MPRTRNQRGSKVQTGTDTLSHDKAIRALAKKKPSIFQQRLNSANHKSCQYCSVDLDMKAGNGLRIRRNEFKPLKRRWLASRTQGRANRSKGEHRCRTSVDLHKSHTGVAWFSHAYRSTRYTAENHTTGNSGRWSTQRKTA